MHLYRSKYDGAETRFVGTTSNPLSRFFFFFFLFVAPLLSLVEKKMGNNRKQSLCKESKNPHGLSVSGFTTVSNSRNKWASCSTFPKNRNPIVRFTARLPSNAVFSALVGNFVALDFEWLWCVVKNCALVFWRDRQCSCGNSHDIAGTNAWMYCQ